MSRWLLPALWVLLALLLAFFAFGGILFAPFLLVLALALALRPRNTITLAISLVLGAYWAIVGVITVLTALQPQSGSVATAAVFAVVGISIPVFSWIGLGKRAGSPPNVAPH